MRVRILALSFIIVSAISMTVIAQDDATPNNTFRFLTATQIIVDATSTAEAQQGGAVHTATNDPFEQTATALVIAATQTAAVNGANSVPLSGTDNSFELTATQLIMDASATAENMPLAQSASDTDEAGTDSPLSLTLIAFGLLIFLLIIIGGGYILLTTQANNKR